MTLTSTAPGLRLKLSQSEDGETLSMQLTHLQNLRDKLVKELEKGQGKQAGSKEVKATEHIPGDTGARSAPGDVIRIREEVKTLDTRELEEGEI